jgi:hypothetical protein
MRQFIYRIWSIEEKKYVMTGSLYGCEGVAGLSQYFNRNTHIIEEYTGLDDIKGNRIFEGDIVRQKFGRKNHYSTVIWDNYGWYLDEFRLAMFDEDLLVVGNIHQTLKKTKK